MLTAGKISEAEEVVCDSSTPKKINSLLNSLKTRLEGLELLNSYLPQCSDEDFIKYCISWMQNCCKIEGLIKNRDYGIKLLGTLFQISSNYQELKKSVSFFITTRYFDFVLKYFLHSDVGWECTEICISLYRGACGTYQETLEKHLKNEVKKNCMISSSVSKCFALLPSCGGGGNVNLNYWKNWKAQFRMFLNICHLILDNLFADIEELQEYQQCEDLNWVMEEEQKNPEHLTSQLYNCCSILNHMLLCKYPTSKAIPTGLVFQLICRGLAINPKSLGKQMTTDIIALQKILPKIHIIFFSLLKALIVTCKNQLLPYAYLVCKLCRQSLEWSESGFSYRGEKPFKQVRITAYETICNWLVATGSGGCMETISNVVLANATGDISIKTDVVVLKESKQKMQHHTKKQTNQRINPKANDKLCFAALKTLQFLVKFGGVLLKPEEQKFLQEFTIKLLVDVQKMSTSDMPVPFSVSRCRKELYSLLLELVQQPCPKWPPPTHFALRIFRKGVTDECLQVSMLCSSALSVTANIIHPQYSNEGFPPSETLQTQRKPVEIDAEVVCPELENNEGTPENDLLEKISNLEKSETSAEEDSVNTVPFVIDAHEIEISETLPEETDEEPKCKKAKMSPEIKDKTPEEENVTSLKEQLATKEKESKTSEDSESVKSLTPEMSEEIKPKKTYFLRSKIKASSEEPEEVRSPDNLRATPLRGLMKTRPTRPRTRALSKIEFESETESKTTKKSEDDEEDIIAVFDDSIIE